MAPGDPQYNLGGGVSQAQPVATRGPLSICPFVCVCVCVCVHDCICGCMCAILYVCMCVCEQLPNKTKK